MSPRGAAGRDALSASALALVVCALSIATGSALAHSPVPDADLSDWCLFTTPRVENRAAVLDCPFGTEVVWWDTGGSGITSISIRRSCPSWSSPSTSGREETTCGSILRASSRLPATAASIRPCCAPATSTATSAPSPRRTREPPTSNRSGAVTSVRDPTSAIPTSRPMCASASRHARGWRPPRRRPRWGSSRAPVARPII
jgi:hypothetical protein